MIADEVELVGVVRLSEKRAPFMPKNNPEKKSWFSRYYLLYTQRINNQVIKVVGPFLTECCGFTASCGDTLSDLQIILLFFSSEGSFCALLICL